MTLNIVPLIGGEATVLADFKHAVAGVSNSITGVPFGNADSTRRILVYVIGNRDGSEIISAMSIGGVSASLVFSQVANLSVGYCYIAHVPNGTSGTITCTSSFLSTRHSYAVYSLYGMSGNSAYATASTGSIGAPVTSRSVSINSPARGVIIGATNVSANWANIDEDADVGDGGFGLRMSCAHREFASAQTGYSVGITHGSAFSFLMAASFGP